MKTSFLFLLLALAAACSPVRVKSAEQAPGVDFTAYRTYNFMDAAARNEAFYLAPGTGIDELKAAVSRELESRGYRRSEKPDLWVNIGVVTQERVQTRQTNFQDAPRYMGQRNYHWKSEDVVVGRYEEGTATVEVVDAARNERVWQGVASSTLSKDPEKVAQRIDEGIQRMFVKFPVPVRP
ncbi:DUF4136 domain-containing protein [Hymenobacter sp. BT175]|uniref:DUF4136 domain-containing protein n=1 Tax=Hymenobacter translucens TaxID=2886507 RepID=UPI001D0EF098|nr:DUF4136 domain-containing protein [Hymenobacter translucens]MCC2546766.1 DUF4136 domain-containing protein [Hymenobacter translucens]